jgi:hypothetical protein
MDLSGILSTRIINLLPSSVHFTGLVQSKLPTSLYTDLRSIKCDQPATHQYEVGRSSFELINSKNRDAHWHVYLLVDVYVWTSRPEGNFLLRIAGIDLATSTQPDSWQCMHPTRFLTMHAHNILEPLWAASLWKEMIPRPLWVYVALEEWGREEWRRRGMIKWLGEKGGELVGTNK